MAMKPLSKDSQQKVDALRVDARATRERMKESEDRELNEAVSQINVEPGWVN